MRLFLRARPDSEHEVSINRIVMNFLVLAYWIAASNSGAHPVGRTMDAMVPVFTFYGLMAFSLFGHLLARPGVSHARRCIGLALDLLTLSYSMYLTGDAGALLYPILLWAILGNGFRYGLRYMTGAVIVSVAGFGCVILATPFWLAHLDFSLGLALGLIGLPAYAATLIRKLSAATRAAEAASRAKSMFLASVSHELRTPLNAIVGLSDLLADSRLDSEQSDMIRTIGRSGRSLASLINSILDVSRMEIGKMPVKSEEVDLFAFLADIRDMLAVQANAKSLRIGLYAAPDTPGRATLNLGHIEEILVNLGGNAVKFTHEGHVLICVAPVAGAASGQRLRFEVRDTGIGIAAEAKERIFERFSQADETIIDRYGGTGLGLTIARQLVEGGGGRIGVESIPGAGSAFWFEIDCKAAKSPQPVRFPHPVILISADSRMRARFEEACADLTTFDGRADLPLDSGTGAEKGGGKPVVVLDERALGPAFAPAAEWFGDNTAGGRAPLVWLLESAGEPPDAAMLSRFNTALSPSADAAEIVGALAVARALCIRDTAALQPAAPTAGDLNILVAEDNLTNQLVIRKILETAGHRVTMAGNGEEALECMGAGAFDLVLMDVNMPVLNGIEAAKLARFVELDQPPMPIVALTADASLETRNRCLEAGMDDCLTKPIDRAALLAWLSKFQANRAPPEKAAIRADASAPRENRIAEAAEPAESPAVDQRALDDLEALGGRGFVDEIVGQFVQDAAAVLKELSQAVAAGDAHAFREQAHALRSCAANVGARKVYDLCLEWRAIDAGEVAVRGEAHMRRLENEFERARAALAAHDTKGSMN